MKKSIFKTVLKDTIPVMTGYIVLGIGFGIIMEVNGFPMLWAVLMSVLIYAGSMQYAAIGLFTGGASFVTVALTTLAVNARHIFYGISMIDKYKGIGSKKPYMIFALTDETYSLVCMGEHGADYCFLVSLLNHIYWVLGTFLGCVIGNTIAFNTKGIDFALTALFITIFTDQWMKTKDHFSALAGLGASVVSLLIFGKESFLIPAMIGIAVLLAVRMRTEAKNDK